MIKTTVQSTFFGFLIFLTSAISYADEGVVRQVTQRINAMRKAASLPEVRLNADLSALAKKYVSGSKEGKACVFAQENGYKWEACSFSAGSLTSGDPSVVFNTLRTRASALKSPEIDEIGLSVQNMGNHYLVAIFMAKFLPEASFNRQEFLQILNQFRAVHGLNKVAYEPRLDQAAYNWAKKHVEWQMAAEHEARGSTLEKRIEATGYVPMAQAENVGRYITLGAQFVFDGWKESPGHRENMLRSIVTQVGVACIDAPLHNRKDLGQYFCVLVLAKP